MVVLPGVVRRWLRAAALREGRSQGDIVADGLGLYRARKARVR
jgi:hypothetical protein